MKNYLSKIKSNFNVQIITFSLIISQNYFFLWNKRFLLNPNYLFFNTLNLFILSLFLFFIVFKLINETKFSSAIKIILYSYILIKLIEIPFFYSNIITLNDLFKNFYLIFLENSLFIMFLKKITPFILSYFFFVYYLKNLEGFFKRFVLIFSIIFFLILCNSMVSRFIHFNKIELNDSLNIKNNNKVIWLVLDEFDPQIAFKKGNHLKNFQKLKENSFLLKNSYSPSSHTIESILSIFLSQDVKDIEYNNFKIFLINQNDKKTEFNYGNTFLKPLKEKNFNFQIISEVLPYCFMLNIEKNCRKNLSSYENYFDAIINTYTPLNYIIKLRDIYYFRNKDNWRSLNEINKKIKLKNEFYLSKKLEYDLEDFEREIESKKNFIFIHLFLPKEDTVASKHVEKFYDLKFDDNFKKYQLMLSYTDLIIKGVLDKIEKNQNSGNTLFIVSSDHWYRKLSDEPKPSLFIAKIINDNLKVHNEKEVMNIFIPDLILKFLENKVRSHNEINKLINSLEDINLDKIRNRLNDKILMK